MNKSRGSGRPACEEAAADAGYARGTWRRAASLSGQAGAGGRADVELLMAGLGPPFAPPGLASGRKFRAGCRRRVPELATSWACGFG